MAERRNENEERIEEIIRSLKGQDQELGIFEKFFSKISGTTPSNQMIIGTCMGWISGFLALKVGRTTMMALGGALMLLQIADENELIKIDWKNVHDNFAKAELAQKQEEKTAVVKRIASIAENSTPFSSGFLGGFLIGLAAH
ncbi:FUN14 domain-containing protein 1-like [Coccinella septempunctata]|uniref:FUN14 domain-containing protein 1-like n=1 Tax=Coccinella septempunctata TaxID=41139 RepID=UPI001D088B6B|nr:FUN14 domain-containing protein 1-like [Coccinella septempunctata]